MAFTVPGILLTGDHASRPAANASGLGVGSLYSCTDHDLIYQTDGSSWSTWATLGSSGVSDHDHTTGGDGGDLDAPVIDGYAVFNEESAPSAASSGTVRVYAKSDGRIYSKDDGGVEYGPFDAAGGGATFSPDPTITQEKAAGASASSITLDSAPSSGQRVILFCNGANTADPTAVSSTNTTWTKVASSASAGAKYSIWVGVVSGTGGTAISITHANAFLSCRAIVTDIPIVATAVQTANHATGASLSGVTVGNVIVIGGGNDNTAVNVSLASSDATGYVLHGYRPGSHVSVISALMVGYAASTTIPGNGTSTSKVLMVELAV